jgi:hypothetical protein
MFVFIAGCKKLCSFLLNNGFLYRSFILYYFAAEDIIYIIRTTYRATDKNTNTATQQWKIEAPLFYHHSPTPSKLAQVAERMICVQRMLVLNLC